MGFFLMFQESQAQLMIWVIYGRSDLEHDRHLVNFLDICRKNTLTLNPDKMQLRLPQVSFFGHQWSAKGLSPDPKKIAVVKRMDLPRDVDTMRSFLGLVNYLNRFSPCLAEISAPLREICRQDMEFELTESVHVAFSRTKEEISRNVTLHILILKVKPHCKPMPPRKDLEQLYYRTPNQSCLHHGP